MKWKQSFLGMMLRAWCVGMMACLVVRGAEPRITHVRVEKLDVVVSVEVPSGVKKLTLESRPSFDVGGWEPRRVVRVSGAGGSVEFRVPREEEMEILRVRADAEEVLPSSLYTAGTNQFFASGSVGAGGVDDMLTGFAGGVPPESRVANSSGRAVVESDIWKITGDTLCFFNQYRGLQVVDVAVPDKPVLKGTLTMPAAGEQMYVVDGRYAVLLARDTCAWWGSESQGQIVVVDIQSQPLSIAAMAPVEGRIVESRLVGSALYVASESYRRSPTPPLPVGGVSGEQYEWGTVVSSFDLSNPRSPQPKGSIWIPRYGSVVTATDRYFFIATMDPANYWQSAVRIIDISSPDGVMAEVGSIRPSGRVADKFKMDLNGTVFTVISESFSDGRRFSTWVQTYSLENPAQPLRLGSVELGLGERLFASRFDGNRVYVVTFLQIDPLWIVDLSNPAKPAITGELEVPGWSTYIQPLGDRLLAAGIETNRVTVSLFDVRNPAKPGLLSKVRLGENYSWSEANYDEKAFGFVPEANLILVPYQGNTTGGYASRVQLIDLGPDSLTARGAIEHRFQPRRSTVHRDRILSLSGFELLTVDATNRDKPEVRNDLELAWNVTRIFAQGAHVVQLTSTAEIDPSPVLRVVGESDPDTILARYPLKRTWPVVGAEHKDGLLYLMQGRSEEVRWEQSKDPALGSVAVGTNEARLALTIFKLDALPGLTVVGEVEVAATQQYFSELRAVWPRAGLLVWGDQSSGYWNPMLVRGGMVTDAAIRIAPGGFWWGGGQGGAYLTAMDVSNPAAPTVVSQTRLSDVKNGWGFSRLHSDGGLVFLSHQTSEFLQNPKPSPPEIVFDKERQLWLTNEVVSGLWVQRHLLNVVDYANPAAPVVRRAVSIPGRLEGVSHQGNILYTVGSHWSPTDAVIDYSEWLDASAYDGVSASLLDSLPRLDEWPHPVLVVGQHVLLGDPNNDPKGVLPPKPTVQAHRIDLASGKFVKVGSPLSLKSATSELIALGNTVVFRTGEGVAIYDYSEVSSPVLLGSGEFQSCFYFDLGGASLRGTEALWLPLQAYGAVKIPLSR